ncbi:AraC family transcriptional regulator [Streptacidiphilus carbonis]|uniref:AraC family transcriptional regulator n=1 Tax=Streptacidiphilus carbonis TaxID=105422 RepID=UPI0005A786C6|nr:helix-turn-helix transcriptional regulator [Streptacidiphilus carbonis]
MSVTRLALPGPTLTSLTRRERVEWHDHDVHQLIYPRSGVLQVSTGLGAWVVPPHRAVWVPAGVPHAHQALGPTRMYNLVFDAAVNPLRVDQPTVVAVGPLLREVITALIEDPDADGQARANLERVALDQLRRVRALPLHLPSPADPRLRDITELLLADPSDQRTLAEFGAAVGAGERTLSRLFREHTAMTFPQWRTQLRLHHSLGLLATGASVTSTATACGYSGTSAFVESFRHAFGTTPGRYRREAGQF